MRNTLRQFQQTTSIGHGVFKRALHIFQQASAALALMLLLSLGVFEPVGCIMHCDIVVPMLVKSQRVYQQLAPLPRVQPGAPDACALCQPFFTNGSSSPVAVAPAPFHEMAPTIAFGLCVALLFVCSLVETPCPRPLRFDPPLLHPPTTSFLAA